MDIVNVTATQVRRYQRRITQFEVSLTGKEGFYFRLKRRNSGEELRS